MTVMLGWLVAKHLMKDWWRYAWMECGDKFVTMDGISEKLKLSVDNWDMMDVSFSLCKDLSFDLFCLFISNLHKTAICIFKVVVIEECRLPRK